MKKSITAFVIMFFIMIVLGIVLVTQSDTSPHGNTAESTQAAPSTESPNTNAPDEHGCLTAAGYAWCEPKEKCLRDWEEACESTASAQSPDSENNPGQNDEPALDLEIPTNWKLYLNNEYGYSFEFPSNCTLGPLESECKKVPPEERSEDCLCFLNGENPDKVLFQTFTGTRPNLTLATIEVVHYSSEIYNPPPGTELVPWIKEHFAYDNIPNEENWEISGIPALKLYSPGGPGVYASENCLFLKNGRLYNISFQDVDNEANQKIYSHILDSFAFLN